MNDLFAAGVGAVSSADIAVPDHEREVRFYSRVLSTGANPLWREEDLMNNLGIPIIGLGERTADYAHLPLQWMPHIQVADVAASAERAVDGGGRVLLHARSEDGTSQWAVLLDPSGAAFGIMPVIAADPLPRIAGDGPSVGTPRVGRIAWLDLTVPSAAASRDFYRRVVGWSAREVEMRDGDERYADFAMGVDGESPVAGVCHARGVNAGLPPVWLLYLTVGDLAESVRRATEEGGAVLRTQRGEDGATAYAVVRDPVGAHVALVPG
jgi:uncharacterized protein